MKSVDNKPVANISLVILSGGQDSVTCLYQEADRLLKLKEKGQYVALNAITFNYGQSHGVELESANKAWSLLYENPKYRSIAFKHSVVNILGGLLKSTSPLVSNTPLETYENAESLPGGLEKTFVPARNLLFLTISANRLYDSVIYFTSMCEEPKRFKVHASLVTGVSQEDSGGYPDCRQGFITSTERSIAEGIFEYVAGEPVADSLDSYLTIRTPLMDLDKKQTVELSLTLEGCVEALSYSHTCYAGVQCTTLDGKLVLGCGKCHSCLLRSRGYEQAGVEDPALTRILKSNKLQSAYLGDNPTSKES